MSISTETAGPDTADYPNDDQVEAFYSDAADEHYPTDEQLCILREEYRELTAAEALVLLAGLERTEHRTRLLNERAQRIVGDIPEGEATDGDLDYVTDCYMEWCRAWKALGEARAALLQVQA